MKLTDAVKSGNPSSLSNEAIRRIAARQHVLHPEHQRIAKDDEMPDFLKKKIEEEESAKEARVILKSASSSEALDEVATLGYVSVGSGIYKRAHNLWSLEPSAGGGYALVRMASEPKSFPVDDDPKEIVQEAPIPQEEESLDQKKGSRYPITPDWDEALTATAGKEFPDITDRYGVSIRVGDVVSYPLGGDYVRGRVASVRGGYLDVQMQHQLDVGVPADFVIIDRKSRNAQLDVPIESPEHTRDKEDKENLNLTMHKSLEAQKKQAFKRYWVTYGASLADAIVSAPNLPQTTLHNLRTAKLGSKTQRVASWISLKAYGGDQAVDTVLKHVRAGVAARLASRKLNLPLAVTWDLRHEIPKVARGSLPSLVLGLKEMKEFSIRDRIACDLVNKFGESTVGKWASAFVAYRKGTCELQKKIAVDTTAKDYWTSYFGEYGDEWVRDVKRRVRADLTSAKLKMQGVDSTAVDYWGNYFGEYGDELVKEVDRAVKKNPKVEPQGRDPKAKSASPMNLNAPPMSLPQPVKRRDIFAGVQPVLNEEIGSNRVALVKVANGYNILVRSGNAQKSMFRKEQREALHEFGVAVKAHVLG